MNLASRSLTTFAILSFVLSAHAGLDYKSMFQRLLSSDSAVSSAAAEEIAKLNEGQKKSFLPLLLDGMNSKDSHVQYQCALVLATYGPAAEIAIPNLIAKLTSPDPLIRSYSIQALGHLGAAGKPAVPALIELLKKRTDEACMVTEALGEMGPAAKEAIPELKKFIGESGEGGPCNPEGTEDFASNALFAIQGR